MTEKTPVPFSGAGKLAKKGHEVRLVPEQLGLHVEVIDLRNGVYRAARLAQNDDIPFGQAHHFVQCRLSTGTGWKRGRLEKGTGVFSDVTSVLHS